MSVFGFRGEEPVLRKRIKQHLRKELIQSEPSPPWDLVHQVESNPYGLDYLCVLDFEATCEEVNPPDYIHEIIEFPVLLLNLKTLEIVSKSLQVKESVYTASYSLSIHYDNHWKA